MKRAKWQKDNERNVAHFSNLLNKYGSDVRALDWATRESQELRFAVLAKVGELNGTSVLDVGCGLGDFLAWFKASGIMLEYTGIDITPKMIEIARHRFPAATFEVADLFNTGERQGKSYDFVFSSGIFYYRQKEPVEFLQEMVRSMFHICKKAVAFNSLSSWADLKEDSEFCTDPTETVKFCRTLTPWITLRHDYHPRDFTIYLYKTEQMR